MDLISIFIDIVVIIIILILRAIYTNWLASRLKWESNIRRGFIANLVWVVIVIILNLLIIFIAPALFIEFGITVDEMTSIYLIVGLSIFIMDVIIGMFVIHLFYAKEYLSSVVVAIIVLITEKILSYFIIIGIYFFMGIILTGGFYLFTPF